MRCPKCGQEMIHINNQYICTACGIVANEFSPRSQVLASIKKKMAAAQTASQQEQYVSPSAVATAEKPAGISTMHRQENAAAKGDMSVKTLDQIAREMVNQNQTREEIGGEPVPGFSVETTPSMIPETEGEKIIPRPEQQVGAPGTEEQNNPVQQAAVQAPETVLHDADGGSLFASPAVQTSQGTGMTAPSSGVTDFSLEVGATGSQMIYPSHQVNPILIKILIFVFALLALFVIGYFVYANFGGAKGFTDNFTRFLGENIFK